MQTSDSSNRSTRRWERRGVAAVEFAVVAPLFLLLLAGIIEFGQAFRIQHMLSIATRRGARSAIVEGATYGYVQQKVKADCAQTLGVSESDLTVDVTVNGTDASGLSGTEEGDEISVIVRIPYSKAGVGFYANTFANTVLSSTCTLEHE